MRGLLSIVALVLVVGALATWIWLKRHVLPEDDTFILGGSDIMLSIALLLSAVVSAVCCGAVAWRMFQAKRYSLAAVIAAGVIAPAFMAAVLGYVLTHVELDRGPEVILPSPRSRPGL